MKSDNKTFLYELRVIVDPTITPSIKALLFKYPVKATGKNFIPLMVSEEDDKEGCNCSLSSRVPFSDLMKIQKPFHRPVDSISRCMYFFQKENCGRVFNLLKEEIDAQINLMYDRITELKETWKGNHNQVEITLRKLSPSKLSINNL